MGRGDPRVTSNGDRQILHLLGGPSLFLLIYLLPFGGADAAVRGGLGLLVWMSWWWIAQPVHLAVTGFLPLVVTALFNFVPAASILPAYAQPLVILLLGANILAASWTRWGLDRRIALTCLLTLGQSARGQVLAWFAIAALLSTVLPNVVVAASMMPIAVAMLRYVGIEEIAGSKLGSALLIAIAWGTSVGGSATPLGGAPNLLVVQFLEDQVLGREFLFTTWVTRIAPLTLCAAAVSFVFMRYAFRLEGEDLKGAPGYFAEQLRGLGSMSGRERWALGLFAAAALSAFGRQLYAEVLPGLTPAFAFLAMAVIGFTVRSGGEPLLEWRYAQKHIVWGLIYLFAGGSALGQILSRTGAAQFLAEQLLPLAGEGGATAVAGFSLLATVLTQVTSNTAAAAIATPITIGTFEGLGLNPIPFVYIVAAAANCGFMLPSSAGGPAVAAGYGVDLKVMFTWGLRLTIVVWAALAVLGYLLATFWAGYGLA